ETFQDLLRGNEDFALPSLHRDLTTRTVLAMSYMPSMPIESVMEAPQEERDRVVTLLMGLMLRELFEFQVMQTDPNFANYRIEKKTGRIVLLDFGATRQLTQAHADGYRDLFRAGLASDPDAVREAGNALGILDAASFAEHSARLMEIIELSVEPIRHAGPYDFGASDLALRLRDAGWALRAEDAFYHVPPADTAFLHRKFGGLYLLARKLRARVDVGRLLTPYL
ncbi:MAG: AarF/UbiB family protein, partial [Pseudomonadota bacterium]